MTQQVYMVDVFGAAEFSGNPVAVVTGADDWTTDEMQRLTQWFNLSETTFLLAPTTSEADYRVRIFTLGQEIPFAGHPTLGTCRVWMSTAEAEDRAEIIQECEAGLVRIRRTDSGHLAFAAPPLRRSGLPSAAELAEALSFLGLDRDDITDAAWIDNGPGWLGIELPSAAQVLALNPPGSWPTHIDIGVVGAHPSGTAESFELRAFFSNHVGAIVEDPVTGSLNASVGQWLFDKGLTADSYTAAQGTRLGRRGRVEVSRDSQGAVWVAGNTTIAVAGDLRR